MSQVRNCKILLLAALLIGAVSTASAGTPCGTNIEYTLDGSTLVLTSPNPAAEATISVSALANRTDFTTVIIPDNVTEIQDYAFNGCTALAHVISRRLTAPTLGTDVFNGCAAGLQICVPALSSYEDPSNNWHHYMVVLCLDENNEADVTEDQIDELRDAQTDVYLFRTLRKAGCFNTMTLPFNVPNIASSPLAGAEVYTFIGANVVDNALQLDITPLTGSSLSAGVPYLIQWPNTGEVLTHMHFTGITWDDNAVAENAGTGQVALHGFYGKTHINDAINGTQHLNLFLGANNTLYWPNDGDVESAKMLGFRAWFQVSTGASLAPVYRGMPASFRIVQTPTDIEQMTNDQLPMTNKTIKNGRIIINRNGESYSITGQKL